MGFEGKQSKLHGITVSSALTNIDIKSGIRTFVSSIGIVQFFAGEYDNVNSIFYATGLADTVNTHDVDVVGLIQNNILGLADGLHGHTIDSIILLVANAIATDRTRHIDLVDNIGLRQANNLVITDALQNHFVETPILLLPGFLAVNDSYHVHNVDYIESILQRNILIIADATHAHRVIRLTLIQSNQLAVLETLHVHYVDALGLPQVGLIVEHGNHAHLADSFDLGDRYTLILRDGLHGHFADSMAVSPYFSIAIDDALHTLISDYLMLGGQVVFSPNENRIFLVTGTERIFNVSPGDRFFVLQ
jgi:hypothetical protein